MTEFDTHSPEVYDMPPPEQISVDVPEAEGVFLEGQSAHIDVADADAISAVWQKELGVKQELIGVVSIGAQLPVLSVVRVEQDGSRFIALGKLSDDPGDGQRARYMALLSPGYECSLGRSNIDPNNDNISRKQARIQFGEDGVLRVEDAHSLNGTGLITFRAHSPQSHEVARRGLHQVVATHGTLARSISIGDWARKDSRSWSIKSQKLSDHIGAVRGPATSSGEAVDLHDSSELALTLRRDILGSCVLLRSGEVRDAFERIVKNPRVSRAVLSGEMQYIDDGLASEKDLVNIVQRIAAKSRANEIPPIATMGENGPIFGLDNLPREKFDSRLVEKLQYEYTLIVIEEALHNLESMPGGSIMGGAEPESVEEEELHIAQFFDAQGIWMSADFLTRYGSRKRWALERYPGRREAIELFAEQNRR